MYAYRAPIYYNHQAIVRFRFILILKVELTNKYIFNQCRPNNSIFIFIFILIFSFFYFLFLFFIFLSNLKKLKFKILLLEDGIILINQV
jgi:hypothetical protein